MEDKKRCLNCKYYSHIEQICTNIHSYYFFDFVNPYTTWCGGWNNKVEEEQDEER